MVQTPTNPSFVSLDSRLPPQNVEAEEAVLGAILFDPEAISRIRDILKPEAFYLSNHQTIYRAALDLSRQAMPTDMMTVSAWLRDRTLLEQIGGAHRLATLVDRVVSSANVDQYAKLISEKYLRRRLLQSSAQIQQLAFAEEKGIPDVLDEAESQIFAVSQERHSQNTLASTSDILIETFAEIENHSEGILLPGVPCGFYDLDAMTQGFQRSDLIIVAGRPSMGKTAWLTNVARNIAHTQKLPVAIFSLEMSKQQLIYRLLSSEMGIETGKLRSGRLKPDEWEVLGRGIDRLSEMPIFIDDTPNITVNEIRSKARRLQAEQGGALGLILIDYLQLMEGPSDNRVQELSKITRSLKGLARELNVPIVSLSQLSRGVESRTNKRPMMSDLRECVVGDTLVTLANGQRVPIESLVGQQPQVKTLNLETLQPETAQAEAVWEVGQKRVYRLALSTGQHLVCSGEHRVYARLKNEKQWSTVADLWGEAKPSFEVAVINDDRLDWVSGSIEPAGYQTVYDLTVPTNQNWIVGNGIVSHNSGSIEQDADVVLMLYREEYYDPDTPDRGITEIIITKHRNGPTGTVKLLFEQGYTRFRNLSPNPQ